MRVLVITLMSTMALAGCSGGSETEPTAAATVTATTTETATATVTTSASGTPTVSPRSSDSELPVALRLRGEGAQYFETPSGNIGCFLVHYDRHGVECTLVTKSFADPPRPADCTVDWSPQFTLGRDATYGACRGDVTGQPDGTVLDYGTAAVAGPVRCESEESGLTCRNGRTGHGFQLARADYSLY